MEHNEDECELNLEIIKTSMEIFYNRLNIYLNKNIKKEYSNVNINPEIYKKILKDSWEVENQIELIRQNLLKKFEALTTCTNNCTNPDHIRVKNDLAVSKNTFQRLFEHFEKRKVEVKNEIEEISEDFNKLNSLNAIEKDYNNNKYIYESKDFQQNSKLTNQTPTPLYDDPINNSYSQSQLQDMLMQEQEDQREYELDQENLIKINEVKQKILELTRTISKETQRVNETLIEIDENVEASEKDIERSNEELRKAALLKNKKNLFKYPLVAGAALGAIGSVVPGVGNLIGATIGLSIGYGVAKLEKKAIQKIEPEKYQKK